MQHSDWLAGQTRSVHISKTTNQKKKKPTAKFKNNIVQFTGKILCCQTVVDAWLMIGHYIETQPKKIGFSFEHKKSA